MNDKISVIIPVYNVEKYIRKCIDSVIHQTYENIEIILIDDGSTDDSGKICDEYARMDSRILVIHQENRGIGYVRNIGLDCATGSYIAFIDSDDYVEKEMLLKLYNGLKKYNSDIAICSVWRIENNGVKSLWINNFTESAVFTDSYLFYLFLQKKFGLMLWNKLFDVRFFSNIRFANKITAEDLEVLIRIFYEAKSVVYINEPLYYYLKRPESLTETSKKKVDNKLNDYFESQKFMFDFLKTYKNDALKYFVNNYIEELLGIYQMIIFNNNFNNLKEKVQNEFDKNYDLFKKYNTLKFGKKLKFQLLVKYKYIYFIILLYERNLKIIEKNIRHKLKKKR